MEKNRDAESRQTRGAARKPAKTGSFSALEKTSQELINSTIDFNKTFRMDYNEKYSKCDSTTSDNGSDEIQLFRNDEEDLALKFGQIIEKANVQHCIQVNQVSNNNFSAMEKLTKLFNTSNSYHHVLKEHLKYMYHQLRYLTTVELQKQQDTMLYKYISYLSSERITISGFIVDFIEKKTLNIKRLVQELEAQNIGFTTTQKWFFQYSKLVNNTPSELTFSKIAINPTLLHRVGMAGGSHLLLFILENELKLPLTKEYLDNMGVNSQGDQAILIHTLNNFLTPSALLETEFSPSAPPETELASETYSKDEFECIVCMDAQFGVLFVPCGHLCCCWDCSEKVKLCPMCGTEISKQFDLKNMI